MSKPRVLVTRRIPQPGLDLLAPYVEMDLNSDDGALSRSDLIKRIGNVEGLLCLLTDVVDAEIMSRAPRLRAISNYAVGFNNIDIPEATRRGISVANTPGVLTETTADLAWALLMSAARRVVEADRFTREGRFESWDPMLMLGADVYGKTLGIIGLGRIGQAVARRARGFDMSVVYYSDPRLSAEEENSLGASFASMETLLRESDFISLHVPLTPCTRHLIGEKQFKMMKPTAVLVNTARGPVVDERALVQALRNGVIGAAGLDVYENEPELAEGLAECPNAVLLPHIASASVETRANMATMAAGNLLAMLKGRHTENIVNPEFLRNRPV
ncbi:MAG: D-glycerate dehydrogenase [Clostridia bacterium]|nr:D-glycerate dehydrogenase [Clostridia bacterium]